MNRKNVIKMAKEDIRRFSKMKYELSKHETGYIKYIVKRKQRKVIGYIASTFVGNEKLNNKQTARCKKGDVFNEFIGKAIVARRIFGEEIPEEYIKDYKKKKAEDGDVIISKNGNNIIYAGYNVKLLSLPFNNWYCVGRTCQYDGEMIIDDTGYINEYCEDDKIPGISPTLSCYDRKKDECDGGCQGCSDCILAQYYRGERNKKPTKKEMKKYIKELKKQNKMYRQIMKEITEDDN